MKFVFVLLILCLWQGLSFPGHGTKKVRKKSGSERQKLFRNNEAAQGQRSQTAKSSAVRASLFPNVPPYYKFVCHNESTEPWPSEIQQHLTWRKDSVNNNLIRNTIKSSGFRLVRKHWNFPWDKSVKVNIIVEPRQKINQIPGSRQIANKAKLWMNLKSSISRHGTGAGKYDFVPQTFLLPDDIAQLKHAWNTNNCDSGSCLWIIKPPHRANGAGVQVVTKWRQIEMELANVKLLVVQQYISPLLVQKRKFDLRLYVFVTSYRPLRAYYYKDGFVRFAVTKFSNDTKKARVATMHLTNRAINKKSKNYVKNDSLHGSSGSQWSVQALWRYLDARGVNTTQIQQQIEAVIIKTLISVEGSILAHASQTHSRYNSYQLYGFDIGIDHALKPWLFEVNISPGMGMDSGLLKDLKGKLVAEYFNIAGYHFPASIPRSAQGSIVKRLRSQGDVVPRSVTFNSKLYFANTGIETKKKHQTVIDNFWSSSELTKTMQKMILTNLTADDVRQLITAEDELTQCDGFVRIFPSVLSHSYLKYFAEPHYYNLLLEAWEQKYGDNRTEGIERLKTACTAKLHLRHYKNKQR